MFRMSSAVASFCRAAHGLDTSSDASETRPYLGDVPRLAACLRALAERDRLVVLLTFYANRDAPAIANSLGMSAGAVRTTRHRALARLRECVLGEARS